MPAMPEKTHDLLVIGAGPAGYVAAIRAAQLGLDVGCVDKEKALGGTCLRVGCIPSKALLESSHHYEQAVSHFADHGIDVGDVKLDLKKMLGRKDKVVQALTSGVSSLFKKNKITAYHGQAMFNKDQSVQVGDDKIVAEHVLIATGSVPSALPSIPFGDRVDSSTESLTYTEVPKKLIVIGAGVIGLELGSVWRRLGSEVTVLEYLDRILPGMDDELAKEAQKIFTKQGIKFELGTKVTGVKTTKKGVSVQREGGGPVEADRVLMAVGRKPNTEGLGLENIGVEVNKQGQIEVDPDTFETGVKGVYAVGDVVPGAMLAHKAEEEGIACVERIVTGHGHIDYDTVAAVVYTHPEIASVGKTEQQLKDEGTPYLKGVFPFLANGRAKAIDDTTGKVKVLAHKETDRVLGVHIIGPDAGDLIAECATAMSFGASSEDIGRAVHAHPTLSEAVKEAALGVAGRSIHI